MTDVLHPPVKPGRDRARHRAGGSRGRRGRPREGLGRPPASCGSCSRARSGSTWCTPSPRWTPPTWSGPARSWNGSSDSCGAGGQRPHRPRGQDPGGRVQGLREHGRVRDQDPAANTAGSASARPSYTHAIGLVTSVDGNLTALLSARAVDRRAAAAQAVRHAGAEAALPPAAGQGRDQRLRPHRERTSASDPAAMSTTAVLSADGTHYVLNGEKLWCTNGTVAELMVVMARTDGRRRSRRSSSRPTGPASRWCSGSISWASRRSRTASSASPT